MRPSREEVLFEHARLVASRGTCSRAAVGCVIALEGRIISSGYNGAPAGLPHCNHECDCAHDEWIRLGKPELANGHSSECRKFQPCTIAVHAEANAIAYAARHGTRTEGAELYTTVSPCLACAMLIINAGIKGVYFVKEYRDHAGLHLLSQAGIMLVG